MNAKQFSQAIKATIKQIIDNLRFPGRNLIKVEMILFVRDRGGLAGNFRKKDFLPFAPLEGMELYEQVVRLASWYDGYFICVMEDDITSDFEWRKDDLLSDGWELVREFAKDKALSGERQ